MDEQRFDAALRALHMGTTRRKGLAGMLGVLLGGAGMAAPAAAGRPETENPCGDGSARANRCKRNADCCTNYCADGVCRLKPNWMACRKNEECFAKRCLSGRCDGGCRPADGRCEEDFNCCDGLICKNGACKKSAAAKCTRQTCPGCCDGTTCRIGGSDEACGARGAACERCRNGATCTNGTCGTVAKCSAATCPKGCCQDGVCKPGTKNTACGTGGAACRACSGNKTCQAGRCTGGGGGGCSAATCASGCCQDGTCKPGTSDNACGTGGIACATCSGGNSCQAKICQPTCDASTCPNGCCQDGVCQTGDQADACGGGGAACSVCSGAKPFCSSGACVKGTWSNQTIIGSTYGSSPDQFNSPFGVWISDDELTMWVADEQNSRISVWTRPGTTGSDATDWTNQTTFGSYGAGSSQFGNATGVAVSADGLTAWIADWENNRASIWSRPNITTGVTDWTNLTTFGTGPGSGPENFENPIGMFVSADGLTAWVSDTANSRISVWTREDATSLTWNPQTTFGSGVLSYPDGLFVSADGLTVYVADHNNSRISIWTRTEATSTSWTNQSNFGSIGTGPSNLKLADGVWASEDGLSVWVADSGNGRVSIWWRDSVTSTQWSNLDTFGSYNNVPTDSEFYQPRSIVLSSDYKTAWVGDYSASRISVWTLEPPA